MAPYNVTVNAVCPGNIGTSMHFDAIDIEAKKLGISSEEMARMEHNKIPLRRVGQPEEIAAAVAFLASSEADYITGAALNVNGGLLFH
jgi:NAD(P)-dependent dehydrogenase (short-subunit alcohol dehydrogenase family)